jgi:FAD/FMN-containing dehydrogenase
VESRTATEPVREATFKSLNNPYFLGENPGLTQSTGWVGAWESEPSVYAIEAESTGDVVAGVNFAREHNLRLAVRGGGHSYQGTSNAPDSLLIWTRKMHEVQLHDGFVAEGCEGHMTPQPAVSVDAGAMWIQAYDAVSVKAGRYVQGGGCTTVGVAGLVQSGGFGSFSKNFGTAAGSLLEAEVVTADGEVRIANERTNPDLFWGLKGGGGGSLGVVTRLTLKTHELPTFFGAVNGEIKASSDEAYKRLILQFVRFCRESLLNPHWGEKAEFHSENVLKLSLVFQGYDQKEAAAVVQPFFDWVRAQNGLTLTNQLVAAIPARIFWDGKVMRNIPGAMVGDDRPGAPLENVLWAGDKDQAGVYWNGYESLWLPDSLLKPENEERLAEAIFRTTRHWSAEFHLNKGLGGAPSQAIELARNTATNPAVLDAFALVIIAGGQPAAYTGVPGHEPNRAMGRRGAGEIAAAMAELTELVPEPGAYVSESNYFQPSWQRAFWGTNYERLSAVKRKYDPDGLFIVRHGVGSEDWSADGFEPL